MLIDVDNISASQMGAIMQKSSQYGSITLKRAYGNWSTPALATWVKVLKRYAIKAVQQFDYVSGKNTTDIALIIDAMCLLRSGIYDGFVLVSSDSDFTPLAIHLHEVGIFVMGVDEEKTPEAFRRSCDAFTVLPKAPALSPKTQTVSIEKIHMLLHKAYEKNHSVEGYTYMSLAGDVVKCAVSDFTPKTYGYSSLYQLIQAFPQKYELKRRGETYIYRCLTEMTQRPQAGKRTIAHRQTIMKYLSVHDSAQRKELEKLLYLQASRTREILRSMIVDGVIVAEGDSKNRVYKRIA